MPGVDDLFNFLEQYDIPFERVNHPAVFTCAEAEALVPDLPGAETKNLFLKDRKGRRHFLLMVGRNKRVDLSGLKEVLGVSKLGFCSEERLNRYLGVTPGAVSVLGLISDTARRVELIIDTDLWASQAFCCHPLVNTATLVIAKGDLRRFLDATGHKPHIMDIPSRPE